MITDTKSNLENSGWVRKTRSDGTLVCRANSFATSTSASIFVQVPLGLKFTKVRGSLQAYSPSNKLNDFSFGKSHSLYCPFIWPVQPPYPLVSFLKQAGFNRLISV